MLFNDFRVVSTHRIVDAKCKDCGQELKEVSNGLWSSAMFCPACESVYVVKLIKVNKKKVSEEFLQQARKETKSLEKA
jgi:uncharacterized Zn finger protein (UPF0148 family)